MAREENILQGEAAGLPLLVLLFALHTFFLMGTGMWSDLSMAGEGFATMLYYAREGVLAAGFLLYAAFAYLRREHPLSSKALGGIGIALVVLFACCGLALQLSDQAAVRIVSALMLALLVGISGGMAYECIALAAHRIARCGESGESWTCARLRGDSSRALGIVVGGGGALAVIAQYVLQISLSLGVWLCICFIICFGAVMGLVWKARSASLARQGVESKGSLSVLPLVCMVVAAACLFMLLPFYEVTILSSGSTASFYEWHRLFLIAGYVVIGLLAFLGGRSAASIAMLVSALFAIIVLMKTFILDAGPLQEDLLTGALFYALLGAVLAWTGIAFMSAAGQSRQPALVASLGRVLSALVTMLELLIPAMGELSLMPVLIAALVLLSAIVVSMVKGGFLVFPAHGADGVESPREADALSVEERVELLSSKCGLTAREQEVLAALVLTENKNQQIADDLNISRRQLQTHISHIYEKTGTTTRAGLVVRVNDEAV